MNPWTAGHADARHTEVSATLTLALNAFLCQVDGVKVRLYGVDAPESKQSCRDADGEQYLCGECCCSVAGQPQKPHTALLAGCQVLGNAGNVLDTRVTDTSRRVEQQIVCTRQGKWQQRS